MLKKGIVPQTKKGDTPERIPFLSVVGVENLGLEAVADAELGLRPGAQVVAGEWSLVGG